MREQLEAICTDASLHARFLNMLSLLEHIGSRKIMASQSPNDPGRDTLKHLAEETRHAFFFKRAAEKTAGRELDYELSNMIAGANAHMYMGRLDAHIADALGARAPAQAAYLYMSLIVELRAVWFYRLYQGVPAPHGAPVNLNSVLAEEELHLSEIQTRLAEIDRDVETRLAAFADFEDSRFRVLWNAVENDCRAHQAAV
ncbi:MAG: hypothetical protein IID54_03600 [Proteobacteria bacterium]|nr:hypothetical protein [Pseudomonadota bacterium]